MEQYTFVSYEPISADTAFYLFNTRFLLCPSSLRSTGRGKEMLRFGVRRSTIIIRQTVSSFVILQYFHILAKIIYQIYYRFLRDLKPATNESFPWIKKTFDGPLSLKAVAISTLQLPCLKQSKVVRLNGEVIPCAISSPIRSGLPWKRVTSTVSKEVGNKKRNKKRNDGED